MGRHVVRPDGPLPPRDESSSTRPDLVERAWRHPGGILLVLRNVTGSAGAYPRVQSATLAKVPDAVRSREQLLEQSLQVAATHAFRRKPARRIRLAHSQQAGRQPEAHVRSPVGSPKRLLVERQGL